MHTTTAYVRLPRPCRGFAHGDWPCYMEDPTQCALEFNRYAALLATTLRIDPWQSERTQTCNRPAILQACSLCLVRAARGTTSGGARVSEPAERTSGTGGAAGKKDPERPRRRSCAEQLAEGHTAG